jgi:hypothetical protein
MNPKMIDIVQYLNLLIYRFENIQPHNIVDFYLKESQQSLVEPLDEKTIQQIKAKLNNWVITLHITLNHQDLKHKMPYKFSQRNLFKKDGYLIHRILELCIACYPRQNFNTSFYDSPLHWFNSILFELLFYETHEVLNHKIRDIDLEEKNGLKANKHDRKREKLKGVNSHLSMLESLDDYKISYEPPLSLPYPTYAYTKLIETSFTWSNRNDDFRKNYYFPFVQAYRDVVRDIKESDKWQCTFRLPNNSKIYRQGMGRGRTKTVIGEVVQLVSINTHEK